MQFNLVSVPLILGVGFLVFLMRLVTYRNRGRIVTLFNTFSMLVILHTLCYVVSLYVVDETIKEFFFYLMVFFTMFIPPAILFFLLEYLGYDAWINVKSLLSLVAIPMAAGILELTDPLHGLFWEEIQIIWVDGFSYVQESPGFVPIILSIYLYLILGISIALLAWGVINSPTFRKRELNIIVMALSIPLFFDVVRMTGMHPYPHLYITPFGVLLSVLLLGLSITKYDFLNAIPAAYNRLFTEVQDAIIVLDHKSNIIDYNRAASALFFKEQEHRLRMSLEELPHDIRFAIREEKPEITLRRDGEPQYFDIRYSSIDGRDGYLRSRVITLHDIGLRKKIEMQLQELIQSKEDLLGEKEELLKEINHRVKNNFNLAASLLYLEAQQFSDTKVKEAFEVSRDRIRTMSLLNERLYRSGAFNDLDLGDYLSSIAEDLIRLQPSRELKVELDYSGDEVLVSPQEAIPCGLIINELVTNSLKHAFEEGGEETALISLKLTRADKGMIQLVVGDNGKGIPDDLDLKSESSLGLRLVHMLGEDQLGGQITHENEAGTHWQVSFFPERTDH